MCPETRDRTRETGAGSTWSGLVGARPHFAVRRKRIRVVAGPRLERLPVRIQPRGRDGPRHAVEHGQLPTARMNAAVVVAAHEGEVADPVVMVPRAARLLQTTQQPFKSRTWAAVLAVVLERDGGAWSAPGGWAWTGSRPEQAAGVSPTRHRGARGSPRRCCWPAWWLLCVACLVWRAPRHQGPCVRTAELGPSCSFGPGRPVTASTGAGGRSPHGRRGPASRLCAGGSGDPDVQCLEFVQDGGGSPHLVALAVGQGPQHARRKQAVQRD